MRVIVMGCGRVGEQISRLMADEGHAVAVIDQNAEALARLGPDFRGQRVEGLGFDRRVLLEAGIEQAEAFAATSSSDNANIVAARLARNVFHVPKVVARLYDPQRAEIYRRLGLVTISSTIWGAERIHELLTHGDLDPVHAFGNGEVCLLGVDVPVHLVGRTVANLVIPGEILVAAITREGRALIPALGTQFRGGDMLHLVVLASAMERLEALLDWSTFPQEVEGVYVIIVGGGQVGSHLARLLLAEGHEIKVIDQRPEILALLRAELPPEAVLEGEGSSPRVLETAGIQRAKVLAAVTAEDEANLVITTLARFEFGVPRIIARVNNPKNAWMFNAEMGVDVALDQADILAHIIADEMSLGDMATLLKLRRGEYSLVEEKLPPGSPLLRAPLRELALPDKCVITAVLRRGQVIIPHGDLRFEAGDEVLAVVEQAALRQLREMFGSVG